MICKHCKLDFLEVHTPSMMAFSIISKFYVFDYSFVQKIVSESMHSNLYNQSLFINFVA